MEILRIYINIGECLEVVSGEETVRMLLFDGSCDGDFFKGTILPGGVDTQRIAADGTGTLSARYMLKGTDYKNQPCSIFIENKAQTGGERTETIPKLVTDSEALKWLETAELKGSLEHVDGQLTIVIRTEE
ncbi:MAG: DUF3237 family protein [Lachnospiraceae bacterium]|nr:DUF3237 family protein [Lachnospiraceae bacterium]